MIPNSFENDTHPAMRGQPKRLPLYYLKRNDGKCGEKSFYVFEKKFYTADFFCSPSCLSVRLEITVLIVFSLLC